MTPKSTPFSYRFSRFAAQGRVFRRVALSPRIHRKRVLIARAMLFFTFWTLSFHSDFVEIHLGRPWGPLGVPRTLLDAPWTSPWTPLGPPSAPMAPEVCSNAGETGFSVKNERLACMRAQLAPPRASVGPPRASVGLPKVAHGVPKDAQGTPSLPFRSYRNGPWTHSWFFYVPTHVNATCHFSLHFSQVGAGGRGRSP